MGVGQKVEIWNMEWKNISDEKLHSWAESYTY